MKVHYGEGVATHTGPESCALRREASREALTGVCVGQVVSGESNVVRGADAVVAAEGNRGGCDSARIRTTPRRLGPWHAHTPPAREPGELRHRPARPIRRAASGRPEVIAEDERDGAVRLTDSTEEVGEQGGARRGGADGGKRWDREECGTAKHGPDTRAGQPCHKRRAAYARPLPGTGRNASRRSCTMSAPTACGGPSST